MREQMLQTARQLLASGKPAEAAEQIRIWLSAHDQDAEAWFELAEIKRAQNDAPQAFAAYLETVRRDGGHAQAHYWLSVLLQRKHPFDALRHLQLALEFSPENPAARLQLKALSRQLDETDFGPELSQMLQLRPEEAHELLNALTMMPAIPESDAEIASCVRVFEKVIEVFGQIQPRFAANLLPYDLRFPQILTYYGLEGRHEKRLREAYAAIFSRALSPLDLPARSGPARIGFVAGIGRCSLLLRFQGRLMRELARLRPQIQWLLIGPAGLADQVRQELPGWGYLPLTENLPAAAAAVARAGIDLLYYWEFGLDNLSYFLAFYKPARIQCTGTGWPATSGLSTMDYYLSSTVFEAPDAQRYYSETLCLQQGLPYPGLQPELPAQPLERGHWGFGPHQHLYLCLQDPLKLHPQLDQLFGRILTADPAGILVLLTYQPQLSERLYQRLLLSCPQHAGRIHLLPRQPAPAYLSLILAADVLLDSWPYSGGGGTGADMLACGTPVVTLAGPELRSGFASGLLRAAGVPELITTTPDAYVELALQIAQDPALRRHFSQRMLAGNQSVMGDSSSAENFARQLEKLL